MYVITCLVGLERHSFLSVPISRFRLQGRACTALRYYCCTYAQPSSTSASNALIPPISGRPQNTTGIASTMADPQPAQHAAPQDPPSHGISASHPRMRVFQRRGVHPASGDQADHSEKGHARVASSEPTFNEHGHRLNHNGHRITPGIHPDGESGRQWFNPLHFARICWASSCTASKCTNVLWPFTIAALVLYFNFPEHHLWVFICSYVGMVPAANLLGFGGQELARKLPKVAGVILETTFGSIVEIILFMVLLKTNDPLLDDNLPVIRAAILGSILANVLFCLGTILAICGP